MAIVQSFKLLKMLTFQITLASVQFTIIGNLCETKTKLIDVDDSAESVKRIMRNHYTLT